MCNEKVIGAKVMRKKTRAHTDLIYYAHLSLSLTLDLYPFTQRDAAVPWLGNIFVLHLKMLICPVWAKERALLKIS